MKILARICALGLVGLALIGIFLVGEAHVFTQHPGLHWLVGLRWPLAVLWIWQAVRLWRDPSTLAPWPAREAKVNRT